MKKSISSRQRQYLGNYLLNLKTPGATFHVIKISYGFQWKYIASFVASTFPVYFLQDVIMVPNVLFSSCHIKISNNSGRPFIVRVWHFQRRKFEAQYLIHVSASRLFMMYWCFCAKNIMALILKTLIWDYSWGKVKL